MYFRRKQKRETSNKVIHFHSCLALPSIETDDSVERHTGTRRRKQLPQQQQLLNLL